MIDHPTPLPTPYELGNGNQTATLAQSQAFYAELARRYPQVLRMWEIGTSDSGLPIHAGLVSADAVFDREQIQREGRVVFFNNNGIHPGEPEGIDVCMALVRDFCTQPERLAALGRTVFLFIPVYNVDGCNARNHASRVDQVGPESYGFRGNALHLDLNRDFIKCDSLAAQAFNRFFAAWSPDVMVDTHTSNGADYRYTMTLIPTQPDKLGGALGEYLRTTMLPAIYANMERRGWPTCPYVNLVGETPDDGIEDFVETPRFSTGYAALHGCIGFMPESHMLKPFADRYTAMRELVQAVLEYTCTHGAQIQQLRHQDRAERPAQRPLSWAIDRSRPARLRFQGYAAQRRPSAIGSYQRLFYDRSQPWDKEITHFNRCTVTYSVATPHAYLLPQAWAAVARRLQWNSVYMQPLAHDQMVRARVWRIDRVQSRPGPYEGHMFHDVVECSSHTEELQARAGDWVIPLDQPQARYVVETLEPQAHDSFFRWGFFNSVLERKEPFSDYVFEDTAEQMLRDEPGLRARFDAWVQQQPERLADQQAVLRFILAHGQRHAEPSWGRYPVASLMQPLG